LVHHAREPGGEPARARPRRVRRAHRRGDGGLRAGDRERVSARLPFSARAGGGVDGAEAGAVGRVGLRHAAPLGGGALAREEAADAHAAPPGRFDAAAEEAGLAVLLSFAWIARPAGAGHATLGVTLGVDDVAAFALFADFVVAEHVAGARR